MRLVLPAGLNDVWVDVRRSVGEKKKSLSIGNGKCLLSTYCLLFSVGVSVFFAGYFSIVVEPILTDNNTAIVAISINPGFCSFPDTTTM